MTRRTAVAGIVAVLATGALAAVAVSGSAGAAGEPSGNQLIGTWQVVVNRPPPLPPLQSLQVFTDEGSVIETANEWVVGGALRTAALGSWKRINGRLYASTTVFFRFHPQTGAFVGTRKISRTHELAQDGQSFSHVARVTTFDPNGNVLDTFVARATAVRMQVERIPDEP
jgi:hypothetical protein